MKRFIKSILLTLSLSVLASGAVMGIAYATSNDQVVQGTTNHTVYKAGSTITISGEVNGDVFCAGQNITINATVNGDILCAGETIDVDGVVNGNVRLAGQNIHLGAQVTRNASLLGQDVIIADGARIGQDATMVGQNLTVNGSVSRDLSTSGSMLTLNHYVGRNISARVNQVTLGDSATVLGNIDYTSRQVLQKEGGAKILGTTTYHKYESHRHGSGGFIFAKLYWLIAMSILCVVLVALCPRLFRRWNIAWGREFWWMLLTGFVAMLAVPVVIITLMLTVIGVPLGVLVLLLWMMSSLFSVPLAAYFVGNLLVPKLHPVWIVLIGSVLVGLLEFIPILGWIVGVIAYWVGTGMLLRGLKRSYPSHTHTFAKME